jgi:hypothetical protein
MEEKTLDKKGRRNEGLGTKERRERVDEEDVG